MALERAGWLFPYRAKDIPQRDGIHGYVYAFRPLDIARVLKIGFTRVCPMARARKLSSQTASLHGFLPLLWFKITDVSAHESAIFAALAELRVNPRKEFFRISEVRAAIALTEYFEREPDWIFSTLAERVAEFRKAEWEEE